ncbi:unnamed protein product, partial [Vitis vinifera]
MGLGAYQGGVLIRWAGLPPELLRDVIKREMCKEIVKSPEFSGKLTFPISLKQPGPRDGTIQCFIKRDKSNLTYHLFLCLSPALLVENGKFLLSAKRNRRTTCTEYVISMDADNISRSSSTYIGKLRSNFLGTKFIIYDTQPPYNGSQLSPPGRTSRRFYSKKVSPKVPTGSYNIAQLLPRNLEDSFQDEGKDRPLVLRNKPPRWHEQLQCWCLNFRGRVTVASVKNFQLIAATQPAAASDHDKIILQFGKVGKDMFTMDYRYPLSAFQAFAICLSSFDTKLACE